MKNINMYICVYISPTFTKINRVRSTVTCNIHTKFERNRMDSLDAIVFIHIQTYIHTFTVKIA